MKKMMAALILVFVFFAGLTFSCVTGGNSGYEGPWYEDPALPGKIEKMYMSRNLFAMRQASIVEISAYAKKQNSKFLILPQNGTAMGFVKGDNHYYAGGVWDDNPVEYSDVDFGSIKLHKFDEFFLQAIDGWLNEEVMLDNWNWTRVAEIRALKRRGIPILVSEPEVIFSELAEAMRMNEDEGFVYYIHRYADYDTLFPDIPIGARENARDINTFADAKNFLYFIGGDVEEDFDELYSFAEDVRLGRLGVFVYSPEEGTDAALMPDQVDHGTASERREALMSLGQRLSLEKNERLIGTIQDVIVDAKDGDAFIGRTRGDAPEIDDSVIFTAPEKNVKIGTIVKVRITDAMDYDLVGELEE